MHAIRRRTAVAAVLLAGAVPAGAAAQTPGDDQYQDPFASPSPSADDGSGASDDAAGGGDAGDGSSGGDAAGGSGGGEVASGGGETAAGSSGGGAAGGGDVAAAPNQLPYTGSPVEAALLAAAGTLFLAGGITLRVRLRDRS
jgi:hypothetical protein